MTKGSYKVPVSVSERGEITDGDKVIQCEACVPEQPIHMLCALAVPLQPRAKGE